MLSSKHKFLKKKWKNNKIIFSRTKNPTISYVSLYVYKQCFFLSLNIKLLMHCIILIMFGIKTVTFWQRIWWTRKEAGWFLSSKHRSADYTGSYIDIYMCTHLYKELLRISWNLENIYINIDVYPEWNILYYKLKSKYYTI